MVFQLFDYRVTMWVSCSLSAECSPTCSTADTCSIDRLACSDNCVDNKIQSLRRIEEMANSEQLAILANMAGNTLATPYFTLLATILASILRLSLL